MKIHGISSNTFAICLCALALFTATIDRKFLPAACIGGIALVAARLSDSWQKRSRRKSSDKN